MEHMLSWRARRQLAALAIVALPVALILVFSAFKVFPEPSCFDNRKNQGEVGVDCGGPCAPCELKNPKPLTLFWARLVPVGETSYDLVALVQNSNELLSSRKVSYKFTLFDGLTPFAQKDGSTFIFPQERVHIVEPNIAATRRPTHVELEIAGVEWEVSGFQRPNFTVETRGHVIEIENGVRRSVARGRILNSTSFDFKEVIVQVIVFDQEGNVLGSNRTLVDNFRAGTRREIKLPWPTVLSGEVRSITVEPRVNILDPSTILKPQ